MNILSLFDGISCGMVALERAGIKVDKYYSSEVDKHAIAISEKNYKKIVRLGDVTKWKDWDIDWSSIDLLIGGSPCQGFSFAGKQLNFKDERSKLFFEYVEILEHIKEQNPKVLFLLENVRMKKEYRDVITRFLKVEPILINSSLASAQDRKRLYWTNIKGVEQPQDKGLLLKDIVHEYTDFKYMLPDSQNEWLKKNGQFQLDKNYSSIASIDSEKAITMTARQYASWNGNFKFEELNRYIVPFDKTLQILEKEIEKGKVGYFNTDSQGNRIYYIHDKSVTLCGAAGGKGAKTGLYLFGCITPDRVEKHKNGQRFSEGDKFYTLTVQDKHGVLIEGYIRKLTPIECERLQTLPDGYTEAEIKGKSVSDNQRYKMLGNGWTVDVIAHILKYIKKR
jgi:DNA (cytosine-5-)-methyltransferase|nr:MAG TPA: Cytosine specific methyltransferase [Caudoviricetes sp.]